MNLRPRPKEELNLNITPLIDIVFLLLIFFMVTTTFNREVELKIELPQAEGEAVQESKNLEVLIDAQGRYFVNTDRVVDTQRGTLIRALTDAMDKKDDILIITADARTPHQAVITAMDAARAVGLVNITFATKSLDSNAGGDK